MALPASTTSPKPAPSEVKMPKTSTRQSVRRKMSRLTRIRAASRAGSFSRSQSAARGRPTRHRISANPAVAAVLSAISVAQATPATPPPKARTKTRSRTKVDRKRAGEGKSVSGHVDLGGGEAIQKKKKEKK